MVREDPPAMERFVIDFNDYTKSIILEAEDRVAGHQRTVNDYLILRRDTCGAKRDTIVRQFIFRGTICQLTTVRDRLCSLILTPFLAYET